MKLSETQSLILSKASQHPMLLAGPPEKLAAAPRDAVRKSMLKNGLLELAPKTGRRILDVTTGWNVGDEILNYRITDVGLRAIGVEPEEAETGEDAGTLAAPVAGVALPDQPAQEAAQDARLAEDKGEEDGRTRAERLGVDPALWDHGVQADHDRADDLALLDEALAESKPARQPASLTEAAWGLIAAWDDEASIDADMIGALEGPPRGESKHDAVLAMLRRPQGASGPQMVEATGWAAHTVRGFLAGLKKKSHAVEVLERVRQVGPNKEGARGSYTVYRVAG